MKKILTIEDDRDLNSTITKFLKMKSFECESAYDGEEALSIVYENKYDLILLDVKLPSMDGFRVAKEIRSFSNIPIVFLTSLSGEENIVKGFSNGGDDYLVKPFSLNELHSRINAVLRRVYKNETLIIIDSNTYFNTDTKMLLKDEKNIHLTQKEMSLLVLFLENPNKIFSQDEIFQHLYDYGDEPNAASLRVFINSLRKMIGKEKIETIKNIGYRYVK